MLFTLFFFHSLVELSCTVDTFLLHYRNAKCRVAERIPVSLTFPPLMAAFSGARIFDPRIGNRRVTILDGQDWTSRRKHVDQLNYNLSGQFADILTVVLSTNTIG